LDDLIVGAYKADPNGNESGKSYVIFGKIDTDAIDLAKLGANSKYAIDHLGDKNANTLTGTSRDEIFVAGHRLRWRLSNHSHHPLTRH
jgi:hypothetical protein